MVIVSVIDSNLVRLAVRLGRIVALKLPLLSVTMSVEVRDPRSPDADTPGDIVFEFIGAVSVRTTVADPLPSAD